MASTQAAARGRQLEAADLWVDVYAFDQAVDGDDLQGAIALYTGDLLLEDRFEPWTEPRREQLRVRHERVLLDWSRELAARDDLRTSMSTLERLVELDPLHEEAHADLIRVLARSGQHRLAVQAYERLATRLRTDLAGVRACVGHDVRGLAFPGRSLAGLGWYHGAPMGSRQRTALVRDNSSRYGIRTHWVGGSSN